MENIESGLSGWIGMFRRSLAVVVSAFNGFKEQNPAEPEKPADQTVQENDAPLDWYSATHGSD